VESKLGEEAPVLESDQVKYIRPMPISLVREAVSMCCILLQNFAQGEGREKVGYASPAPQISALGGPFTKGFCMLSSSEFGSQDILHPT
jgi:hypothetical protein